MKKQNNTIECNLRTTKYLYDLLNGSIEITKNTNLCWTDGTASFEIKVIKSRSGKLKLQYFRNSGETSKKVVTNSLTRMLASVQNDLNSLKKGIGEADGLIYTSEHFKHCYFWNGDNGNSSQRSWYSKYWSIDESSWYDGIYHWDCSYSVSQSRHNTYASGYYKRNDNVTNLNAVRASRSRMESLVQLIKETFPELAGVSSSEYQTK